MIVGSARSIVEHCGVARFLFTDFPLGNPFGIPYNQQMQQAIVRQALDLLEQASEPQTTQVVPFDWGSDQSWRDNYMKVRDEDRETLRAMGEERRQRRNENKRGKT